MSINSAREPRLGVLVQDVEPVPARSFLSGTLGKGIRENVKVVPTTQKKAPSCALETKTPHQKTLLLLLLLGNTVSIGDPHTGSRTVLIFACAVESPYSVIPRGFPGEKVTGGVQTV